MELNSMVNQQWEEPVSEAKPFFISKWEVWEAYKRVKANQGAAGVDQQSIADFEKDLKGNLYKIWNRMSSGSYFPPPVRTVKIPKANGGERKLGIPTVADRIAQQVVKSRLEPAVDPLFHRDSYGYRPGKSALEAVGQARQRCWRYDWILDLDIKGFFDNIPKDLLLRAVKKHAKEPWMVLYIERWLQAPEQEEDGQLVPREKGTPQGGVITPLTQKVIFSSSEQLQGGKKGINCLISVVESNIFMPNGALHQGGEGSPNKCRSWPAAARNRVARGSASPVTGIRFVRAAGIPLLGRSLPARSAGENSRNHSIGHLETSAPDCRIAPKVCEEQRSHYWSDRNRRGKCVSADTTEAWLSRIERAALFKFMFPIPLIACSS